MTMAQPQSMAVINTLTELDKSGLTIVTGSESLLRTTFEGNSELYQRLIKKTYLPRDLDEWNRVSQHASYVSVSHTLWLIEKRALYRARARKNYSHS